MSKKLIYHAVRIDAKNSGPDFWGRLREHLPKVARSLEKNGCAIVSYDLLERLEELGAFIDRKGSPLIDYGPEGPEWADVAASRHQVFIGREGSPLPNYGPEGPGVSRAGFETSGP